MASIIPGMATGRPITEPHDLQRTIEIEVARQTAAIADDFERKLAAIREQLPEDRAALVVFSGDLDKALAAFVIAIGATAAGLQTTIFFTFWGLSIIRRPDAPLVGVRSIKERIFAMMTPGSVHDLGVSKMNYFGIGSKMLRAMMKEKEVASVEEMMEMARELGVRIIGCTMSMDVMGIEKEDFIDGIELGGVAAYLGEASRARVSLFI